MELDTALALARKSEFRKVRDYRRNAYMAMNGQYNIVIESTPHDHIVSGGFGFEHDEEYRITVIKGGTVVCRHTFTEKDLAGFGDTLHHEIDGDARIKRLFDQLGTHRIVM